MADATNTLAAILNLGDANVDFEVSDLLQATPVLAALEAVSSSHGHTHKYIKETVAAGTGFRAVNAGVTNAAGSVDLQTITLQFLDASLERDIALVKAFEGGEEAYISSEIRRSLRAALVGVEKQIIYGTGEDAGGFDGIGDTLSALGARVLDGGDASAGAVTSVYAIKTNSEGAAVIYNNGGTIDVSDAYKTRVEDDGGDPYTAMRVDVCGYLGLQLGNIYQLGRLANIGASANTLDDDGLSDLVAELPEAPDFLVMTRQSRKQLQQSRTATTTSGAYVPSPMDHDGLPIIVSEQVVNTETVLT